MGSGLDADTLDATLFPEAADRYLWGEVRAVLPHKCQFTGQTIYPFQKAMKGIRKIHGLAGDTPVYLVMWAIPEAYTFAVLKGDA